MSFITIHNCETGEITQRELTAKEIKQRNDQYNAEMANEEAKATARQALLDKLGITADEAKLLLG